MDIYCDKNDLAYAINIASKAVPNRTTLPILECLLISATDKVTFTANDTEMGIETSLDAEIKEQGRVAIDAKIIGDIVRKLPDGEVHIRTTDNDTAKLTCGKTRFQLATKNAEEFPYIEEIEKSNGVTLKQYDLREIIRQTIFATAQNESNKMMTGELFEIGDTLKVTALDGHRVAIRSLDLSGDYDNIRMIIPSKTLIELSKVLSDNGDVKIYSTVSNALFEFDNTILVSRLIEGDYFDVSKMIQNDFSTQIKVSKRELIDSLDRTTLLAKEIERKPVIMTIGENFTIEITTNLGSMNETIDIEREGEELKIGFNPRFLLDALRAIDDSEVTIYFQNPKSPCYIKDSGTYNYMVLPINFA